MMYCPKCRKTFPPMSRYCMACRCLMKVLHSFGRVQTFVHTDGAESMHGETKRYVRNAHGDFVEMKGK